MCIRDSTTRLRASGIRAELYPEAGKLKKQMGYADAKKIPFVALVGEDEISSGKITVKDMSAGTQEQLSIEEIVARLKPGI